jgi:hypothetical protein
MSSGENYFKDALQADATLTGMLKEVILKVGQITIDLRAYHIRISTWVHKKHIFLSGYVLNR